jgi:dihydrolipoyl dehydrogenase
LKYITSTGANQKPLHRQRVCKFGAVTPQTGLLQTRSAPGKVLAKRPRRGCEGDGRLLKFSVCWDAAVCAVSAGGFFSVWDNVANEGPAPRLIGLTPLELFFECDCGEEARASPVLAPAEGRLRVAKYDVAIIGSGPGGYVAAIRAGELGLKTVVVEKDPYLGGTCLHVGCIPTKVLLHHAEVYDQFKNGAELGFEVSGLKINWANVLARKDKIVKKHSKGIEFLFKKNKVEWVQGWGRYEGPGRVSVEKDGKKSEIEAANILMVSGSEAKSLPGIEPDHKTILTNRSILQLPEIPKTLIVVGAGAVGVEFASIYNSFGTQVTILEALPRIVPVEDEEISAELTKAFQKKGIQVFTSCAVESVKKDAKGVTVAFKHNDGKAQTLQAEKLLLAVGRKAMTDGCGLEKSKAKLERGFVQVGDNMETAEKGLYAIGDIVAGLPQLAHAAMMEGIIAVTHIAGKPTHQIVKTRIPNATYCEPQIGSIGLTEKQARDAGHDVKTGKFPFVGNSKATILGSHGGFIKVVSDKSYGEVLGIHIIGPLATELLSEAATVLNLEGTIDDMMNMVHAHPTVWEAMGDAFASVRGLQINV